MAFCVTVGIDVIVGITVKMSVGASCPVSVGASSVASLGAPSVDASVAGWAGSAASVSTAINVIACCVYTASVGVLFETSQAAIPKKNMPTNPAIRNLRVIFWPLFVEVKNARVVCWFITAPFIFSEKEF